MTAAAVPTTRGRVLVDVLVTSRLAQISCVAAYVLAIAASAQVAVPLPGSPVPITLQTFVVLLGAAALGPLRSAMGVTAYLAIGAFGVPWFAVTGGATLGYLAGFFVAALLVGRWARAGGDRSVPRTVLLMAAGNLVIYAFGVIGLMAITGIGLVAAVVAGVAPFLVGDALKIVAAAAALPATWRLVGKAETRQWPPTATA